MAIQSQPSRISEPFAGSGTRNVIPATNSTPSASQAASWASGFPPECSQPISAGGCPVPRNDMNGVLNWLSQDFAFGQDGGIWEWSALADYDTQRMVRGSDGKLYWSVAQSGPGLAAGAQDPVSDNGTYWLSPPTKTMPASDKSAATATTEWVDLWYAGQLPATDYYVDPVNGDNANSGTSAAAPFKTVYYCNSIIKNSKFVIPSQINIHLVSGTYSEQLVNSITGIDVVFIGPDSGFASFTNAYFGNRNTSSLLSGRFQFSSYMFVSRSSVVQFQDGMYIEFNDLGSTARAITVTANGLLTSASGAVYTVAFAGTNTFSQGTIQTTTGGRVNFVGTPTFTGTVTGKRYNCTYGSGIGGAGSATLISGSTAGTVDSTSYYY